MRCRVSVFLLVLLFAAEAFAHARHLSRSRWRVRAPSGVVGATLSFEGQDLQDAAKLDAEPLPDDPDARAEELKRRIYAGLGAGVKVTSNGAPCAYEPLRIERRKGFEVGVRWDCGGPLGHLKIELSYLRHMKPDHRHLARFSFRSGHADVRQMNREQPVFEHRFEGAPEAAEAPSETPSAEVAPAMSGWTGFTTFFREGLLHIATGWDHILFLLALLALGGTLWRLAGIVTAFTLAHSITLGAAYLGWVDLPGRLVESVIAASIVFVALENLWMREGRWRWVAAFGFGLIHGFGFAGFLTELDMARDDLVSTLLGFNLGVEAGQLAVVLLVWPALHFAQQRPWHRRFVVVPLSLGVAALGAFWFVERAFS